MGQPSVSASVYRNIHEERRHDPDRPLVKILGDKKGDNTCELNCQWHKIFTPLISWLVKFVLPTCGR